jgi:hypothetical protein
MVARVEGVCKWPCCHQLCRSYSDLSERVQSERTTRLCSSDKTDLMWSRHGVELTQQIVCLFRPHRCEGCGGGGPAGKVL